MSKLLVSLCVAGLFCAEAASAATVDWNTWTSNSAGTLTAPSGTVTVSFDTANSHAYLANSMNWAPSSTFADGIQVANGPANANAIMALFGGNSNLNTLTFSTAVVNPVISFYSLGASGSPASFVFNQTPTLIAGGPSSDYGGSSITVSGNTVTGAEGNGTVQFIGTYTQLTWTNPNYEYWYGFNVGASEAVAAAVPEPHQWALMLAGLAAVGSVLRRRSV